MSAPSNTYGWKNLTALAAAFRADWARAWVFDDNHHWGTDRAVQSMWRWLPATGDRKCESCGEAIRNPRAKRFCSRTCICMGNKAPRAKRICPTCRETFSIRPCDWRLNFCSLKCAVTFRRKDFKAANL